jgi:hypothetical protein
MYQIGDVDMKNSETLIITDNVSTQDTIAEVIKLLLLDSLAYSEILSVIIKVSEFFIPTSPI